MTAPPPDPDPASTPDLESGGGVAPGSTPPESAQTSGLSASDPRVTRRLTPTVTISLVAIGLLVLVFAAVAVLLVLNMGDVPG